MRSGISLAVSLVSASLLSIACARPLVLESTNDSAAICKRDLATDVAKIQASTDYLVCRITEQIKETAIMIGMVGLTRRTCTPPGGATTTPAAITPAAIAAAVAQQPAAVSVPSTPKPPAAVLIPIPTTPSPTPLAATPATPKTTPVSAAPVVAAPSPVVAPAPQNVIVPISAGPTAADLNACISTDADVCFQQAKALEAHNASRRKHHVPDLVWNHELAAAALKYALKAHWGHSHGSLFPSSYVYGENIYASTLVEGMADGLTTISTAIMAFTNEEVDYDYANPGYSDPTGHFTQVVWKDTREVGCAIINSYAVCEYYPSGNYNGQFAANVFAP